MVRMELFGIFLIAFALSVDSASVGVTYGMRNLTLPWRMRLLIAICTGVVLLVSMSFGSFFAHIFSPEIAKTMGGVLLIVLGVYICMQFVFQRFVREVEPLSPIVNIEWAA
ncbi:MAG: manganese efflux pump, partial [Bacilli bacterium]